MNIWAFKLMNCRHHIISGKLKKSNSYKSLTGFNNWCMLRTSAYFYKLMYDCRHSHIVMYLCSFFPYGFLKFSKIFWFLKFYAVKIVFFLFMEETDLLLFRFVLKKPYFSIFHTSYLIYISPYLRALANLGCQ